MREFTKVSADCFHDPNDAEQVAGVRDFIWWTLDNPRLKFYWPNYDKAPWHIQCMIQINEEEVHLNFWPHRSKGQFKYEKVIEPLSAFIEELNTRLNDVEDDFDVVE